MRPVRNLVLVSFLLLVGTTSSCNSSDSVGLPWADFSHSVATFTCGPVDQPATLIFLARQPIQGLQPANPYISVMIAHPGNTLAGTTWTIGTADAGALYWASSTELHDATSGTVRIDQVVPQERVTGSVELRFPDRTVTQSFDAPWIESFFLCA